MATWQRSWAKGILQEGWFAKIPPVPSRCWWELGSGSSSVAIRKICSHSCPHWRSQMKAQLFTSSLSPGVDRWAAQLYSSHFLAHTTDAPGRIYSGNKPIPNRTPRYKLQHGAQTSMQTKFTSRLVLWISGSSALQHRAARGLVSVPASIT